MKLKNFLLVVFSMLVTYVLAPFVFLAATSWFWLPVFFLPTKAGFVIGAFITAATIATTYLATGN